MENAMTRLNGVLTHVDQLGWHVRQFFKPLPHKENDDAISLTCFQNQIKIKKSRAQVIFGPTSFSGEARRWQRSRGQLYVHRRQL